MAKLTRVPAKVFAASAAADEIGQFGSAVAGTKLETSDVATIQGLSAWLSGWSEALVSGNRYPALQEMNGTMKVLSYQGAYALQEGIPEYDSTTPYYIGSIVKKTGTFELYGSLTDNNAGNLLSNEANWKFLTDLSKPIIMSTPFCANSGNVNSSGDANLLSYSGTTLSFKVGDGTTYKPLYITYADRTQEVLTSLASITGLSTNGNYTIVKEKGQNPVAVLSSKVTQGKVLPAIPVNGDYFCLTATGLQTFKRVSGAWVETQYIVLGTVIVAGGVITTINPNGYNNNGYNTYFTPVMVNQTIFSGVSAELTNAEYSLEFLPNDNGIYEVYFTGYLDITGTSSKAISISSSIQTRPSIVGYGYGSVTAGSDSTAFTNNRKIIVNKGSTNSSSLHCRAYRKVG